jgi:hypothetical protein
MIVTAEKISSLRIFLFAPQNSQAKPDYFGVECNSSIK